MEENKIVLILQLDRTPNVSRIQVRIIIIKSRIQHWWIGVQCLMELSLSV